MRRIYRELPDSGYHAVVTTLTGAARMRNTGLSPRTTAALAIFLFLGVAAGARAEGPEPNPALTAEDVVRIQMGALRHNDVPKPDAGIEVTFRFASPRNKAMTGPLPRFAAMVRGPIYLPMINHRRASFENMKITGDDAEIDVIVEAQDGKTIGYRFSLTRQHGNDYDGSWMTDSVAPIKVTTL